MKTLLVLCASLAVLGCASTASPGPSVQIRSVDPVFKFPAGEGSFSAATCLEEPECT